MGLFEGLLGGFQARKSEVEQRNFELGQQQSQKEAAIFSHLMTSDDPQVRTLALTGLLDSANPRRKSKGLKGWIGETESSPYLQQMSALINTPVEEPNPAVGAVPPGAALPSATLPSRQSAAGVGMPSVQPAITEAPESGPAGPSAGMPTTSPVQPGVTGAPPTPVSYTQQQATPFTTSRMRNVFLTGADKVKADKVAAAQGDIEGEKAGLVSAGFSEPQALEIIRRNKERQAGTARPQSIQGEVPNGQGGWTPAFGVFENGVYHHPETGQPLEGFRPRTSTGSTSMGTKLEPLAHIMFGLPFAQLNQQQQQAAYGAMQLQGNALDTKGALAAVNQLIPNASVEQKMQLADALMSGTQQTPQPVTGAPPALGTTPAATTPSTTGSAPAAVPPGAAGATPPATAPVPTPTPGPTAAALAIGAPGAPPKPSTLSGSIPGGFASANKETGKPLDAKVQEAFARTRQMNDIIDKAMRALEPYKTSNKLDDTMKLVEKYRAGTEDDPFALAVAQLPDLAGLQQSASATLGGTSRSQRVYADKRQHVPRIPSGRQIMFAHDIPGLNADRVNSLSQLRGDEGGFDAPSQIYLKLAGLRDANNAFLQDMTEAAQIQLNPIKPVPSHGGPPAPTSVPGASGQPYLDPKTNTWIIPN
jgi:hypothetical protein